MSTKSFYHQTVVADKGTAKKLDYILNKPARSIRHDIAEEFKKREEFLKKWSNRT